MDRTYFQKADLSTLSSDDASSIHQWYRQLVQQATSANIDLCPLRSFDSLQALWPSNTVPNLVIEMAQALLTKIDPCIDKTNSVLGLIYAQEITNSDSKLAAYYFLHAILRHADLEFIDKIEPLPVFNMFRDPIKFAHALLHFQTSNSRHQRTYTDRAISQHFLMELVANDFTLHTQYQQLRDLPTTSLLPESLLYTNIALTLASTTTPNGPSIDVQPPLPIAHRNERPERNTPRPPRPSGSTPSASDDAAIQPFRHREEVQCIACGIWGHRASRCSNLAKFQLLQTFATQNPTQATAAGAAWKELHSPANRRSVAHSLQITHPLALDAEFDIYDLNYDYLFDVGPDFI